MKEKWWAVIAYYPLTYIGIGVVAETAELAKEQALAIMEDEWGKYVYKYQDISVEEQD